MQQKQPQPQPHLDDTIDGSKRKVMIPEEEENYPKYRVLYDNKTHYYTMY